MLSDRQGSRHLPAYCTITSTESAAAAARITTHVLPARVAGRLEARAEAGGEIGLSPLSWPEARP